MRDFVSTVRQPTELFNLGNIASSSAQYVHKVGKWRIYWVHSITYDQNYRNSDKNTSDVIQLKKLNLKKHLFLKFQRIF